MMAKGRTEMTARTSSRMSYIIALLIVAETVALTGASLGAWRIGDTVWVSVAVTFAACATIVFNAKER